MFSCEAKSTYMLIAVPMENVELEENNAYEKVNKKKNLDIKHMEPCCAYGVVK